jgi:hypothetical protein
VTPRQRLAGWIMRVYGAILAGVALGAGVPPALGETPPLTATLSFKNAPADLTFSSTDPASKITLVLQIENVSSGPVITTDGFSATDFFRRLFFTSPSGGTVVNAAEAAIHADNPVFQCLSRRQVLQATAIPVALVETLAGPGGAGDNFFREYVIDDARGLYDLTQPGHYSVSMIVPLQIFLASDPDAVIADCDQFPGSRVVNVGAVTGRQAFTIASNTLEFTIAAPPSNMLTGLEPAMVWIGSGPGPTPGPGPGPGPPRPGPGPGNPIFDLLATVRLNGRVIGTGEFDDVSVDGDGFKNAVLEAIPLTLSAPVAVSSGDSLSIEVDARSACGPGPKKPKPVEVKLWYNGRAIDSGRKRDAGSRFSVTVGGLSTTYFLRDHSALATTAGPKAKSGNVKLDKCGIVTPVGTWGTTLP